MGNTCVKAGLCTSAASHRDFGEFQSMNSDKQQQQGSAKSLKGDSRANGQGPSLLQFIFYPWICAVVIILITTFSAGNSFFWVVFPSVLIITVSFALAMQHYTAAQPSPTVWLYAVCVIAGFSGFIVSLVTYFHFLQPYHDLGLGATYLDMLPSQSAMGATDATALVFAQGTSIDNMRTFGWVDPEHPDGDIYCVAPLSNQWTMQEPGVQFFAAGTNCCGKATGFGCSQGGSGARGAVILAREDNADPGFKAAVQGAAVKYGLQPGNGWLLLTMVQDPMQFREDRWGSALKLLFIFVIVFFLIACVVGFISYNMSK